MEVNEVWVQTRGDEEDGFMKVTLLRSARFSSLEVTHDWEVRRTAGAMLA